MGVLEELRARQGDPGLGDVGRSEAAGLDVGTEAGMGPRLVPPLSRKESFGRKRSLAQLTAWKGVETTTGLSSWAEAKSRPEPSRVEAVEVCLQEVGLKTKLGRST
jgi:hypothetical protein